MSEPIYQNQINRLGFDAWADNMFTNAYEDFVAPNGKEGVGEIAIESPDYNLRMIWTETTIACYIRAYTKDGWKEYQKEIKR